MLATGNYSSHLVPYLSEGSASLGTLKTCLCAGSAKIKEFIKAAHKTKPVEHLPINVVPKNDQLNSFKVTDFLVTNEKSHLSSFVWNRSYVSAETFGSNKNGLFQFVYQGRLFHDSLVTQQYVPKKHFSTRAAPVNKILFLERRANAKSLDPEFQAEYLQAVVDEDPEYVIERHESGKYASNKEVEKIYMKALLLTDRISVSEAAKRREFGVSHGGGEENVINISQKGTMRDPIYVVSTEKGSGIIRYLRFIGGGILILFIANTLLKSNLNFNQKEFLPDQSEKKYRFSDVEGCDEAKEELQEVVQFLKNPEKFEKFGAKLPRGVLLIGPPGTGKTLLARAIAGEADVPFYFASGSEFEEMFVGVGSARVRKLFAAAKENSPSIVFIDELDAIGGARVVNSTQPYARMTLNQLLVELDGFDQSEGVIVIGATNFPESLDKALMRPGRFDSKVNVTLPDVRGRVNILKLYIDKENCADDVDEDVLARSTPGFTGADLSNLVNQAKLRAASLQLPLLTMEHFNWAREKIVMGPERKSLVVEKKNQIITAYHESGHAIVAIFTPDAPDILKATIMPRGNALGYVMQLPEKDELSISKKQLLAKIDFCMGGRVAEEILLGEDSVTTGASSDMIEATRIARAMVTRYGMSDKIGTVMIDESQTKISPELQSVIEGEVKQMISESYFRAKTILSKHAKEHKRLAEGLLKYETLDMKEIDLVINGLPIENK